MASTVWGYGFVGGITGLYFAGPIGGYVGSELAGRGGAWFFYYNWQYFYGD